MSARRNLLYMGIYENAQTLSASNTTALHPPEVPSSADANGSRRPQGPLTALQDATGYSSSGTSLQLLVRLFTVSI